MRIPRWHTTSPKAEPCHLLPPSLVICHHPATLSARLRGLKRCELINPRLASLARHLQSPKEPKSSSGQCSAAPRLDRSTKVLDTIRHHPQASGNKSRLGSVTTSILTPDLRLFAALSSIFPISSPYLDPSHHVSCLVPHLHNIANLHFAFSHSSYHVLFVTISRLTWSPFRLTKSTLAHSTTSQTLRHLTTLDNALCFFGATRRI